MPALPDQSRPATARRNWTFGLCVAQIVVMIAMTVAAAVEVETIVGTGPALTMIGLALAYVSLPLGSELVVGFALSGPIVCLVCAVLIARLELNPRQASELIPALLVIYLLIELPFAIVALRRVWRWRPTADASLKPTWRFSLRSLLLAMTAMCIIVPAARAKIAAADSGNAREFLLFDGFVLATATLIAATIYLFVRRRKAREVAE